MFGYSGSELDMLYNYGHWPTILTTIVNVSQVGTAKGRLDVQCNMADVTLAEFNLEGASLTVNLPFSGGVRKTFKKEEESESSAGEEQADDKTSFEESTSGGVGKGAGLAVVGVLVFLVVAVALAKHLLGSDEDDSELESSEEGSPVGVSVSSSDD